MRARTVLVSSAVVALGVAGYATLAPGGLPRMQRQRAEAAALRQDVAALEQQTDALRRQAALLQGEAPGAEAHLEGVIREALGYVRDDEHLLHLPPATAEAAVDR